MAFHHLHRSDSIVRRWFARIIPPRVKNTLRHGLRKLRVLETSRIFPRKPQTHSFAESPYSGSCRTPDWHRPTAGEELREALREDKPLFLHVPWTGKDDEAVRRDFEGGEGFRLLPLDLFGAGETVPVAAIKKFALEHPVEYRRMLLERLFPLKGRVSAVIIPKDYIPALRMVTHACRELTIPTLAIPDLSLINIPAYYRDAASKATTPAANIAFCMCDRHRELFAGRGYPAERCMIVGFEAATKSWNSPVLSKEEFCGMHGFVPSQSTLFLDIGAAAGLTANTIAKLKGQVDSILQWCGENQVQVAVHMKYRVEKLQEIAALCTQYTRSSFIMDLNGTDIVDEAMHHCDAAASCDDAFLRKAHAHGWPVVQMATGKNEDAWFPVLKKDGLDIALGRLLDASSGHSMRDWTPQWRDPSFNLDRGAAIRSYLEDIAAGRRTIPAWPEPIETILSGGTFPVIASDRGKNYRIGELGQGYLAPILGANARIHVNGKGNTLKAVGVDLFVRWGVDIDPRKRSAAPFVHVGKALGRPIVNVENALVSCFGIGMFEHAKGMVFDDLGMYFDASRPSRLEVMLETGPELTQEEKDTASRLIEKIVNNKLSKYNLFKPAPVRIGREGKRKILLIDQVHSDASITFGNASDATFRQMFADAVLGKDDWDIIVKQHPDSKKAGKASYFTSENIDAMLDSLAPASRDNIFLLNDDVNPYSLLECVDEVFVATSTFGFEALMAGKKVTCYGTPFYSGWGVTNDKKRLARRTRKRSIEDIFHFLYVKLSRYYNPNRDERVTLDQYLDYFIAMLKGGLGHENQLLASRIDAVMKRRRGFNFEQIRIELTNRCGYRCSMCPRDLMTREKGEMSLADMETILDRLPWGYSGLFDLQGFGEALLVKDFPERLRLINRRFPESRIQIFTTLGVELGRDGYENLIRAGLNHMTVSFYGYDRESYKRYHGVDLFDLARENIGIVDELSKTYGHSFNYRIRFMERLYQNKAGDDQRMRAFRDSLIQDGFHFYDASLHNYGSQLSLVRFRKDRRPCSIVWGNFSKFLQISHNGNVIPCCFISNDDIVLGNLVTDTLEDIFCGVEYRRFVLENMTGNFSAYKHCGACQKHFNGNAEDRRFCEYLMQRNAD